MRFSLQLPVFKAPPALTYWEIKKQTKSSLEREESDTPVCLPQKHTASKRDNAQPKLRTKSDTKMLMR